MELCSACDRTTSTNYDPILCSSSDRFWLWHLICAQFYSARVPVSRLARFSRLLGGVRISYRDRVASQHMGQSRLHTDGLSSPNPNRFDYRPLGNHLCCVFVCGRHGNFVEWRGRPIPTP